MFTLPSIALSVVIASLIGLFFYLIFGRGWLRLAVYVLVANAGFFLGQVITTFLGLSLFPIGSVNVLEASITSLIALFAVRALWRSKPSPPRDHST